MKLRELTDPRDSFWIGTMRFFWIACCLATITVFSGCGPIAKSLSKTVKGGSKAASKGASKSARVVPLPSSGGRMPGMMPVPVGAADDIATQSGKASRTAGGADNGRSVLGEVGQAGVESAAEAALADDE